MSVYYCDYCQKHHDDDWIVGVEHPRTGDLICEEGFQVVEEEQAEAGKFNNNRAFSKDQMALIRQMENSSEPAEEPQE